MKKLYEEPKFEIVMFESEDVLALSTGQPGDNDVDYDWE